MSIPNSKPDNLFIRIIGIGEQGSNFIQKRIETPINNIPYIAMDYDQSRLNTTSAHHQLLLTQTEQDKGSIAQLLQDVDFAIIFVDLDKDEDTQIAIHILDSLKKETLAIIATKSTQDNAQIQSKLAQLKAKNGIIAHSYMQQETEKQIEEKWIQLAKLPNLIDAEGLISLDYADIKSILSEMKEIQIISATATGKNRAEEIAHKLSASLTAQSQIKNGVVYIQAGADLGLDEVYDIMCVVSSMPEDSSIVVGTSMLDETSTELEVIVFSAF